MASTTTEAAATSPEPFEEVGKARHRRYPFSSLRTRILVAHVGLLALATLASVLIARQVLIRSLDERIDRELTQEAEELRLLAAGADPATGRPFGDDVRRIFRVALEGDIPARNEVFLTFVHGRPFLRSRQAVPYRLDRDPSFVRRWATLSTTDRGSADTPSGRLDFLATPLRSEGRTLGVFVVARFRDLEKQELDTAVYAVAGAGLAILLVGSILAWQLGGGLLRPVKTLTRTARSISESDLSRRIHAEGRDEIAELAITFNHMLDRLESAFSTQRRFVDDAGHELRTPITIVRGHLELLDEDPAERKRTVALVLDELDRMSRIVDDLLQLAKAEEPDFLTVAPTDVAELTDEVHAKAGALAPREWLLEERAAGIVLADRQRLTQALVQLAQNAVQYGDEQEPIAIGSSLARGELRLWVRDRGRGIPEREQERIFERFARGGGARRSDGAGLGLAIVKAIAEAHDGRVEVASEPGVGSTFTLILPVRTPPRDDPT
ncbi:MAG TPA: ATP-binding protein [Gaiellaceae bacterium]|jgi:signal transduction histidine kinase